MTAFTHSLNYQSLDCCTENNLISIILCLVKTPFISLCLALMVLALVPQLSLLNRAAVNFTSGRHFTGRWQQLCQSNFFNALWHSHSWSGSLPRGSHE